MFESNWQRSPQPACIWLCDSRNGVEDQMSRHIFPCLSIETFSFASKRPRGTVYLFPGASVVLLIKQKSKQSCFPFIFPDGLSTTAETAACLSNLLSFGLCGGSCISGISSLSQDNGPLLGGVLMLLPSRRPSCTTSLHACKKRTTVVNGFLGK